MDAHEFARIDAEMRRRYGDMPPQEILPLELARLNAKIKAVPHIVAAARGEPFDSQLVEGFEDDVAALRAEYAERVARQKAKRRWWRV